MGLVLHERTYVGKVKNAQIRILAQVVLQQTDNAEEYTGVGLGEYI